MGHGNVSRPAAVICDIYGTLLDFGPVPGDSDGQWQNLCREFFPGHHPRAISLDGFEAAVARLVEAELAAGRARGAIQPEVDWPALAARVLPALDRLDAPARAEFFFRHARLARRTRLMPGAAEFLEEAAAAGAVLGIASNAQASTLLELDRALADAGVSPGRFDPDLCFYSFEHGFAKPDPRVFEWLSQRLVARGIAPSSALMVGDSAANDIGPAAAAGWGTWHLRSYGPAAPGHGPWRALLDAWLSRGPGPQAASSPGLANPGRRGTLGS
jgi:putative hydrolase of the HAD superfamily